MHMCLSLSYTFIWMQMSIRLFIWMHTEACVHVCVRACDMNVCSLCSPCCSAPTVPLGPICLPVINSSGLTMQRFMTLFGLTNYHTPLSLSLTLSQEHSAEKLYIGHWMLNLYWQLDISIILQVFPLDLYMQFCCPFTINQYSVYEHTVCSVSARCISAVIVVGWHLNFPSLCQFFL